jgi:hypothetical protein
MPIQQLPAHADSRAAARRLPPAGLAGGLARATAPAPTSAGKAGKQGNGRVSMCRARTKRPGSRASGSKWNQKLVGQIISLSGVPVGVMSACTAGTAHFLADAIIAAIIAIYLAAGIILVAVMVFGSTESCDRFFRLLHWIRDQEEPPAPEPDRLIPSCTRPRQR